MSDSTDLRVEIQRCGGVPQLDCALPSSGYVATRVAEREGSALTMVDVGYLLREGGREGWMEGRREGVSEGVREGVRDGGRKRWRGEGRMDGGSEEGME